MRVKCKACKATGIGENGRRCFSCCGLKTRPRTIKDVERRDLGMGCGIVFRYSHDGAYRVAVWLTGDLLRPVTIACPPLLARMKVGVSTETELDMFWKIIQRFMAGDMVLDRDPIWATLFDLEPSIDATRKGVGPK